jgi:hypothetical protein
MQCRRTFLVVPASRVDEGAAEGDQRSRQKLAVLGVPSSRDRGPHVLDAGFDGSGSERSLAGFDLREDGRSSGDARRRRHFGRDGRGTKSGTRVDAKLASEEIRARFHLLNDCLGIARRAKTADEKDVGVLLVGVEANEFRGMTSRARGFAAREERQRRLMKDGAGHTGDMAALALEP